MINLVLDTNILHQEGLRSGRMEVLKNLIDAEIVKIYIPEIVKREFITKRVSQILDSFKTVLNELKKVHKKIESNNEVKDGTNSLEQQIKGLLESVDESVNDEFSSWENELKVELLPFLPENISTVLDDYFSGSGAFRALKQRDDIPDSMIHTSICQLAEDVGEVYFALKDGAFKKYMEKDSRIKVFNSLAELFKSDEIDGYLANEQLTNYFEGKGISEILTSYFTQQSEITTQIYIPDGYVKELNLVGVRVFNAEINGADNENIQELFISNFYVISETNYTADISFVSTASLHFISDYGSYLELERVGSRDVDMDSMNNEGVCDLYENYHVRFSGKIEFSLSAEYSFEKVSEVVNGLTEDDKDLDIILDIESAALLGIVT